MGKLKHKKPALPGMEYKAAQFQLSIREYREGKTSKQLSKASDASIILFAPLYNDTIIRLHSRKQLLKEQQLIVIKTAHNEINIEIPGPLPSNILLLELLPEILNEYMLCCPSLHDLVNKRLNETDACAISPVIELTPALLHIINRIHPKDIHNYLLPNYYNSLVLELLTLLVSRLNALDNATPFTAEELLLASTAKEIILRDFEEFHTVEQLAKLCGTFEAKLQAVFKYVFGQTVATFSREARLQRGYELLQTTNYPIRVICTMVGYEEPSNFSVAFKNQYSCWPGRVQKQK